MKRFLIILALVVSLLLLLIVQNRFLFGLPFIHAGSQESDVDMYMGWADYYDGIGFKTNSIYFVGFFPIVFATVDVNVNS